MKKVTIDGIEDVKRVKADSEYCVIRTKSAGVFVGKISSRVGDEVVLHDARRIWRWVGAATLSQLAIDGTSDPKKCKFPVAVPEIVLFGVIEIIPMTEKAKQSVDGVEIWKA